jgi:hypothetical protein
MQRCHRASCDCYVLSGVSLGDGVEEINKHAFATCTSLRHIIIPNAVKAIGYGAYWGWSGLTTVTLSEDRLEKIREDGI